MLSQYFLIMLDHTQSIKIIAIPNRVNSFNQIGDIKQINSINHQRRK